MSKTLYICVDESGEHAKGTCYTVAGCWHVSDRTDPTNVLSSTKDRLISVIEDHQYGPTSISELKGASLPPTVLDDSISWFRNGVYEDRTIESSHTAWNMTIPVGFTFSSLNAGLAVRSLSDFVSEVNAPQTVQTLALNSVLTPLFHPAMINLEFCDRVRILLDASTWQNAADRLTQFIPEAAIASEGPTFEIRDSKATPGIQFADLAAYSWRRNMQNGDCDTATGILHDLRFSR